MEREALLVIVASALFGVVVWFLALPVGRLWPRASEPEPEPLAWWRLVFPLFAGFVVLAFLLGWAFQAPDPADKRAGIAFHLLAVFTLVTVMRAIVRSLSALRSNACARFSVGTIGLLTPRIVVSEEFRRMAPATVLLAALGHEAAHARGRDPLRIWLAQLAADLQWPIPGTGQRLSAWLLALEVQRDDEAVANGASPEDLAEAILTAARLHCAPTTRLHAGATGSGEGIAWRVRRLLSLEAHRGSTFSPRGVRGIRIICFVLVVGAVWLGLAYGDAALGALPGMGQ